MRAPREIVPRLLLAATGVGGGDLATGAFVGSLLGTGLLWAVVVGAFLKYVITEGVARWQLATGNTFLEGIVHKGGPVVIWAFLPFVTLEVQAKRRKFTWHAADLR